MDKQEPVGWLDSEGRFSYFKHLDSDEPLYTAPPKRDSLSWVELTDEEIRKFADKHLFYQPEGYEVSGVFAVARAIEARLKEKNG